ncbi:amidase family protein [Phyllosticta citriasiana]|uniref:amidase n=1 Tax=Phyllosticta citriasiana TaxID=595635 RepID=A0ABR1L148_9PEZI
MSNWKEKSQSARDYRDASLAKVDPPIAKLPDPLPLSSQELPGKYLTPREYELTHNFDAIELLGMLRRRELSSEELTRAFLRHAALAQYAVNCVTELMWDEAITRARYLDSQSKPLGPLHGLPISIKQQHGMRDKPCHASYVAWIGEPSNPNPINDILYASGCVFYVRTTEPQSTMQLECINNVTGLTVNPWNRNLTPGGSSGGEGALLGMGGSVLGIGGDIGGSVRCPAANNGVYGFKPTTRRLPLSGMKCTMLGNETVMATFGPLTRSRETINLFMDVVLKTEPWRYDPSLFPKQWTPVKFDRPLKIAVQWWDGIVKPHPPMIRAMREVSDACRAAGMKVVDWVSLDHAKAWDILSRLYFPDGGEDTIDVIRESGEPLLPLTEWIINQPGVKKLSIQELWALCRERDNYRADYAAHWSATAAQDGQEVDVILCPATPGAAPPHECSRYWPYTAQWNLLDYPGVVFPVTFVDPAKDKRDEHYVPMNEKDKFNHELYSPEKYVGAPVSLQVIGRRNHDEKVMAALEAIERAMGRDETFRPKL